MRELPSGTVTFLFSDIEGSTRLLHELGDGPYVDVLQEHRRVLRAAFAAHNGTEIRTEGDSFFVVFVQASDAVAAAVAAQRGLEGGPVRVRIGLHTGEPLLIRNDYVGMVVHRAARISAVAHGGQVLLSEAVARLVDDRLPAEVGLRGLGQVRLKDLTKPEHVYQVLHPQLRESFPALRSLERTPNNLPQQVTSFVGRERELAQLKHLLQTSRLVTLVGVGGLGKSRLSLQAGAEVLEEFADGVWLVELAALTDARLVPQAIASVLGVKEEPKRTVQEALRRFVRDRQLLLILDNCEHLVQACTQAVTDLLHSGPRVKVLATSRELLRVDGEQSYPLPTLSLPDATGSVNDVGRSEAVQLFVERAQRQRPSFALTKERASAAAQLCIHLDGIPLALELAAARTRSLSVEQLAARIEDRFRLLTMGTRTALPRHQTLRAAIDWSYDLLSPSERTLFRRLAVFAGGFTLDAAEQVCSGAGSDQAAVLDLLATLVDKSLVVFEERGDATRYWMLETVRQYAWERLEEVREVDRQRDAHLGYFVALAEEAEPQLKGSDQQAWLDRLETEHDNLRSALVWSTGTSARVNSGLRVAGALSRFWEVRGYQREGRERVAALLAIHTAEQDLLARAKALNCAGNLAFSQGDYKAARSFYEQSLEHRRSMSDRRGIAVASIGLGAVAHEQGEYDVARALYQEGLAIFRDVGDRANVAVCLGNLGLVTADRGDCSTARALLEEALSNATELGDQRLIGANWTNLGEVALAQGDYPAAMRYYEEGVAILRRLGALRALSIALTSMGNATAALGDVAAARTLHAESLALQLNICDRRGIAASLESFAHIGSVSGRLALAPLLWGAAERLREEIGSPLAPGARLRYDRQVADARASLDDDTAFDRAWEGGRAISMEQAIEYALSASKLSTPRLRADGTTH